MSETSSVRIDTAAACRRLLAISVALLPASCRRGLVRALAWLWFDAIRFRRRLILENLGRAFPEWTEVRRREIGRESLRHLCAAAIETCQLPFMSRENYRRQVSVEGEEHFERARAGGRGVLLLTLHLGNVEMAMAALSLHGVPLHVIAKRFRSRFVTRLVFDLRKSFGTRFIDPHGPRTAMEILRGCGRNEAVVFVLDQYMRPQYGVETTFFGHRTGTASGLALFALKSRAPVIPVYSYRDASHRLRIVFEEPVPIPEAVERSTRVQTLTQAYNDRLEAIVRRHPGQWMWVHRRWKPFC
jgi:Kdo2-lipid IVA lauroyltransferase/acyltransferase